MSGNGERRVKKKIVVFGSYVADLTGTANHLPCAGETVFGEVFCTGAGGKGSNQMVAAHRADADVLMITKIGRDTFGEMALDFYNQEGISTECVLSDEEKTTGIALICVDAVTGQNQILVVPGACAGFEAKDIETVSSRIQKADILLVQFEVNMDALRQVIDLAKEAGVTIILNPAPARENVEDILRQVDVVTPNEVEAEALTGIKVADEESAKQAADVLHAYGITTVVITMGSRGVFVSTGGKSSLISAFVVKIVDTTGAGDAFNGAFAASLAEGADVFAAAGFANAAASLCVQAFGTAPSMPQRKEIEKRMYEMQNSPMVCKK